MRDVNYVYIDDPGERGDDRLLVGLRKLADINTRPEEARI